MSIGKTFLYFSFLFLTLTVFAKSNSFEKAPSVYYDSTKVIRKDSTDLLGNVSCSFNIQSSTLFTGFGQMECSKLTEQLESARRAGKSIAFVGVSGRASGFGGPRVVTEIQASTEVNKIKEKDQHILTLKNQLQSCEARLEKLQREITPKRPPSPPEPTHYSFE